MFGAFAKMDVASVRTILMATSAATKDIDVLAVICARKPRWSKNLLTTGVHEANLSCTLALTHNREYTVCIKRQTQTVSFCIRSCGVFLFNRLTLVISEVYSPPSVNAFWYIQSV